MRFWPFSKQEERIATGSYSDTLVQYLLSQASGGPGDVRATAALEACAGLVGRAFAVAEVQGSEALRRAMPASLLTLIGRELIIRGELVVAIDMVGDMLRLWPAADYDITGQFMPESWNYRINLAGPSLLVTRNTTADSVLHFTYATDPTEPWRGRGPVEVAALAGRLSAQTAKALADESSTARGYVLPIPGKDGDDPSIEKLKADIKTMDGGLAFVESMADGFGTGDMRTAPKDWEAQRLGATPPASLVDLQNTATREILAACGVSPALFDPRAATAAREGWRQLLFGVVSPIGRIVSDELSLKFGMDISLGWEELRASDLSGRARAFQSMVGGGMAPDRAAALAGLMVPEDT